MCRYIYKELDLVKFKVKVYLAAVIIKVLLRKSCNAICLNLKMANSIMSGLVAPATWPSLPKES